MPAKTPRTPGKGGSPRSRASASAGARVGAQGGEPRMEGSHDKLGRALTELLENPLVTGTIGRALGAREKAAAAQELAMGALNLPSAADIERLTRRVRSVSQRLEGVEDGVQDLGRSLTRGTGLGERLVEIEGRLESVDARLAAIEASLAAALAAVETGRPAAGRARKPRARG